MITLLATATKGNKVLLIEKWYYFGIYIYNEILCRYEKEGDSTNSGKKAKVFLK
jgi:hypothetical protein